MATTLRNRDGSKGVDSDATDTLVTVTPLLEVGARTGGRPEELQRDGIGVGKEGDPMFTLQAGKQHGVAIEGDHECSSAMDATCETDGSTNATGNTPTSGASQQGSRANVQSAEQPKSICVTGDKTHALDGCNRGKMSSEDGTGRGVPVVGFYPTGGGQGAGVSQDGVAYTVDAAATQAVAYSFDWQKGNDVDNPRPSTMNPQEEQTPALGTTRTPAVAFTNRGIETDATAETIRAGSHGALPMVACSMAVRRLTPRECERLQGFPDDYTKIPYRNKPADQCPDGPRYRALGNSFARPVVRWIGERIEEASE